jgi:MFS family permease
MPKTLPSLQSKIITLVIWFAYALMCGFLLYQLDSLPKKGLSYILIAMITIIASVVGSAIGVLLCFIYRRLSWRHVLAIMLGFILSALTVYLFVHLSVFNSINIMESMASYYILIALACGLFGLSIGIVMKTAYPAIQGRQIAWVAIGWLSFAVIALTPSLIVEEVTDKDPPIAFFLLCLALGFAIGAIIMNRQFRVDKNPPAQA